MCSKRACAVSCFAAVVLTAGLLVLGYLVGAPAFAQYQLKTSHLTFANSTLLPCDNFAKEPHRVQIENDVVYTLPGMLGATMHSYNATLSSLICEDGGGAATCEYPRMVNLGTLIVPEAQLNHGHTTIQNTVVLHVSDSQSLMKGFILPQLALQRVVMQLDAEDVSVSVSFLKIGGLHVRKVLTCEYIGMPPNPTTSSEYCPPDQVGEVIGISIACTPGEFNVTRWHPTTSSSAAPAAVEELQV
mmetsp:Transcript_60676/g.112568  ORF Transcript_60676/g.112568 Transcript_60676/m.112568 type:complete len:244 (-) Transcript_60676:139-870(-)